jgi:xanthine dehydrogenase small subunit
VAGNLCRCTGYSGVRRAFELLDDRTSLAALLPGPVLAVAESLPVLEPQSIDDGRGWLAGATDEIPEHRHAVPAHRRPTLLNRVPELRRIVARDGGVEVGSAVTIAHLQSSDLIADRWPQVPAHLEQFGSPAVRAAGTVGGNLVHASPTADLAPPLLAMGAVALVAGSPGRREVPLAQFFLGYHHVDLGRGEMLQGVWIPDPPAGSRLHLEKIAKRRLDDIASVTLAVLLTGSDVDVRIAAGGVAPIPLLLTRTADALRGRRLDAATLRAGMRALAEEVVPIDDVRGSAAYKRRLLGHLLVAALVGEDADLAAEVIG